MYSASTRDRDKAIFPLRSFLSVIKICLGLCSEPGKHSVLWGQITQKLINLEKLSKGGYEELAITKFKQPMKKYDN